MTRLVLDTSAYSALLRGHAGIQGELQTARQVVMSAIVLGELRAGFRHGTKRESNEEILRDFLATPRVQQVSVTDETTHRYAEILASLRQKGTPIPTNDLWIAANAMEHGAEVLTTDPHFTLAPQILTRLYAPE